MKKDILTFASQTGSNGRPVSATAVIQAEPSTKAEAEAAPEAGSSLLSRLRDILLSILDGLEPITNTESSKHISELRRAISECGSMEALNKCGGDMATIVRDLAARALEQIHYANDFLAELGKDLSIMEKQLFSYQDFNRETHLLNDKFRDNLVSRSSELKRAFDSNRSFEETRNDVTSRLMTLGLAIENKRQEDEIRFREADKKIAELQSNIRNYNDEVIQVTERAKTLEKEVFLDALTGVGNRRAYEMQIRESLRRYHRDSQPFSIVLMDVDRFKNINDKYGHAAGDKCLRQIVKLIVSVLRKTDFFARYGGEEFLAILPECSAEEAGKVAEKVRLRIERTQFYYHDEQVPVTISLGVTEVKPEDKEPDEPFVRADKAMYQAKTRGRNNVRIF